jgi:hypothetical protein
MISTILGFPKFKISLQYRYFSDDKFIADTTQISVIEAQLRFVEGLSTAWTAMLNINRKQVLQIYLSGQTTSSLLEDYQRPIP